MVHLGFRDHPKSFGDPQVESGVAVHCFSRAFRVSHACSAGCRCHGPWANSSVLNGKSPLGNLWSFPEIITPLWAMDFFGWEAGVFGQLHPRLKVHHRVLDPHGTPCNVVRLHKRLRRGMCTIIHDPMPKKTKICNIIYIHIYIFLENTLVMGPNMSK